MHKLKMLHLELKKKVHVAHVFKNLLHEMCKDEKNKE